MSRLDMAGIAAGKAEALISAALDLMIWEAGCRAILGSTEIHRITSIGRGLWSLGAGQGATIAAGGGVPLELGQVITVEQMASKAVRFYRPAFVVVVGRGVVESDKHVL